MAELTDKLKELLETQGVDGDFNIDAVAEQLGLDDNQKKLLAETCNDIDEIDKNAEDLENAKKEGYSLKEWFVNKLWDILGNAKEEDKGKIIEGVDSSIENRIESLANDSLANKEKEAKSNEVETKEEEA